MRTWTSLLKRVLPVDFYRRSRLIFALHKSKRRKARVGESVLLQTYRRTEVAGQKTDPRVLYTCSSAQAKILAWSHEDTQGYVYGRGTT